jgi:hypothetical protein
MKTNKINKKAKKAQMKIQQMSFMLIAVFMFFSLVGMIMVTMMLSNLRESATNLREQNAKLMASRIASSPEFSCGEVYGGVKTDCIDLDKVMALKENIDKYSKFWGVSNIQIKRIYPPLLINNQPREVECTRANYPRCNLIEVISNSDSGYDRFNYVILCRKERYKNDIVNRCEMGQIILRYEEATSK